ncbi:MAG: glycosyltransferase N-terminal domain-containing protein [Bacteroidota bacterium]
MLPFQLLIYNLSLRLYYTGIALAAFFNPKAKQWIDGRENLQNGADKLSTYKGKRIWFHCASLGEFEQARPVLEAFGGSHRQDAIIVTFFSPSGYEVRKNYPSADFITYLPLDTKQNAKEFIDLVRPDVALFVKYEFWYHYLNELKQRNIPTILFSSVFRKEQIFFQWHGELFRKMLGMFSKIFVQNSESLELLSSIGIASEVAFDTRFDRVNQIAKEKNAFAAIELFKAGSKIFIAGSTWPADEELLLQCIADDLLKEYKYILAPHQVDKERISELQKKIKVRTTLFSNLNEQNAAETDVVIVDTMGNLASLYSYGEIAYIGGGFNAGVHNVLEAAVYGMPVIFGPRYQKSLEAVELTEQEAAFSISSYQHFIAFLSSFNEKKRSIASLKTKTYVSERLGGTDTVLVSLLQSIGEV